MFLPLLEYKVSVPLDVTAPWNVSLSQPQYQLVFYSLVVAGLALFAQFVKTWVSAGEVSSRYRPALYASMCICGVAFLSYVFLALKFDSGYQLSGGQYVPTAESVNSYLPRYMDWSVTVPLLMVEALAVSTLTGGRARQTRLVAMSAAFLMIFTGYLGAGVIGNGTSSSAMLLWGIISTVFFALLYVVLLGVLRASHEGMSPVAYLGYRNAVFLLLLVWVWYPIAYGIHNWTSGGTATTIIQVGFCAADIAAKAGFGAMIHKVAKVRTADDMNTGEGAHPEDIWVSSVKLAAGAQPVLVTAASMSAERVVEAATDTPHPTADSLPPRRGKQPRT
ncbi:bacteriorhodopsin-like [Lapillicoccus jejuensis]